MRMSYVGIETAGNWGAVYRNDSNKSTWLFFDDGDNVSYQGMKWPDEKMHYGKRLLDSMTREWYSTALEDIEAYQDKIKASYRLAQNLARELDL